MKSLTKKITLGAAAICMPALAFAQRGGADILNEMQSEIQTWTDPVSTVCFSIAGIIFLIAAVVIIGKTIKGNSAVGSEYATWGGAILFFVLAGVVVRFMIN